MAVLYRDIGQASRKARLATGFATLRGGLSSRLSPVAPGSFGSALTDAFFLDAPASGAGVSGSLSVTLDNVTFSSAGSLTNRGAFSATLDSIAISATGSLTNRGALSSTLDSVTFAATGSLTNRGAFGATLADVVLTATGEQGAATAINGVFSATLDDITLIASGQIGDGISGTDLNDGGISPQVAARWKRRAQEAEKRQSQRFAERRADSEEIRAAIESVLRPDESPAILVEAPAEKTARNYLRFELAAAKLASANDALAAFSGERRQAEANIAALVAAQAAKTRRRRIAIAIAMID